jgi:hypothetical protein
VILDREIELYILREYAADSIGSRRRFRPGVGAGPPRLVPDAKRPRHDSNVRPAD